MLQQSEMIKREKFVLCVVTTLVLCLKIAVDVSLIPGVTKLLTSFPYLYPIALYSNQELCPKTTSFDSGKCLIRTEQDGVERPPTRGNGDEDEDDAVELKSIV